MPFSRSGSSLAMTGARFLSDGHLSNERYTSTCKDERSVLGLALIVIRADVDALQLICVCSSPLIAIGTEILLRLWQEDSENHDCNEPLGRDASKTRPVSKMIDDHAQKYRTEGGTDTH